MIVVLLSLILLPGLAESDASELNPSPTRRVHAVGVRWTAGDMLAFHDEIVLEDDDSTSQSSPLDDEIEFPEEPEGDEPEDPGDALLSDHFSRILVTPGELFEMIVLVVPGPARFLGSVTLIHHLITLSVLCRLLF